VLTVLIVSADSIDWQCLQYWLLVLTVLIDSADSIDYWCWQYWLTLLTVLIVSADSIDWQCWLYWLLVLTLLIVGADSIDWHCWQYWLTVLTVLIVGADSIDRWCWQYWLTVLTVLIVGADSTHWHCWQYWLLVLYVLKASCSSASGSSVSLTVTTVTLSVGECVFLPVCDCDRIASSVLLCLWLSLHVSVKSFIRLTRRTILSYSNTTKKNIQFINVSACRRKPSSGLSSGAETSINSMFFDCFRVTWYSVFTFVGLYTSASSYYQVVLVLLVQQPKLCQI